MKRYATLASFVLLADLIACGESEPERASGTATVEEAAANEVVNEAAENANTECLAEAQGAVMALKRALVSRLVEALGESPEAAVEVCAREAESMRARVQQETGVEVGRASSRLRNHAANGSPPPWVRSYLTAHAEGEEREPVEWSQRASGKVRLVSPLITGELCLTCHGEDIAPPTLAALDLRYPNDAARGYHGGDLRGVVWATAACE
ncbi:MAG: hypothetical protein ACI9KE_002645 [Polyangiales bacterium]|jgi:hypothetical protein